MFFIHIFCLLICLFLPKITGQVKATNKPFRSPHNFPSTIPITKINYENWANELKEENLWIATPSIAQDVVTLANYAQVNGYKLRATGFMHNWSHLTITKNTSNENVILVDTTKKLISMEITSSPNLSIKTVTAQAGVSMQNLLSFLEQKGFGLYATPALGDITIGGALAIGGHGTGIPAVGEKVPQGHAYGSLSNLVVSVTAVAWDSKAKKYVLKTFQRSDIDAKAFLVHLGRTFITEVTLMVGPNYNLRCQSYTDISGEELFADPMKVTKKTRTFASFLDKTGRIETILFPFTNNKTWLKVWSITSQKPLSSRKVSQPYNYIFSTNIPKKITELYANVSCLTTLNRPLSNAQFIAITTGLRATLSFDIWGPSKNLLLYVTPTTLRMSANGYTIITTRKNIQKVVSTVVSYYNRLWKYYYGIRKFPLNGSMEIRTTLLDQPSVVPKAESPAFSPIHPINDHPEFDVSVWIDILNVPNTPYLNEAMAKYESFLYSTFDGKDAVVRCEWSKGWAYTDKSAWSNATVYGDFIPATFPSSARTNGWKWAVSTLNKYDPNRIFTNDFIDKLLK